MQCEHILRVTEPALKRQLLRNSFVTGFVDHKKNRLYVLMRLPRCTLTSMLLSTLVPPLLACMPMEDDIELRMCVTGWAEKEYERIDNKADQC